MTLSRAAAAAPAPSSKQAPGSARGPNSRPRAPQSHTGTDGPRRAPAEPRAAGTSVARDGVGFPAVTRFPAPEPSRRHASRNILMAQGQTSSSQSPQVTGKTTLSSGAQNS